MKEIRKPITLSKLGKSAAAYVPPTPFTLHMLMQGNSHGNIFNACCL